jgi:hypothetical protein
MDDNFHLIVSKLTNKSIPQDISKRTGYFFKLIDNLEYSIVHID